MMGNELLDQRLMRLHRDRLIAEGERMRLARSAPKRARRREMGPAAAPEAAAVAETDAACRERYRRARAAAAFLGRALVEAGNRLQSLEHGAVPGSAARCDHRH